VDPAPSGGRALRMSSCHIRIACHGKAASPVVGRAVYAFIPEVSFSCPLILLRWQIRLTCKASSPKKRKKKVVEWWSTVGRAGLPAVPIVKCTYLLRVDKSAHRGFLVEKRR